MSDLFGGTSASVQLSDAQRLDWLRLIRSESVGPRTFRSLINRFGGAAAALRNLPDIAKRAGKPALRLCSEAEAEAEYRATQQMGARFVALGESGYPKALAAIETAPPLIAVLGRDDLLLRPMVSVVGSRNASAAGARMAEILAAGLGTEGVVVVSGLARGIDARAHLVSIGTGTVAVLAGGLAHPYPPDNLPLFERIAEQGCVVSEMPLACVPRAREFPRRNRIVSGLSLATVVVEAARRSGSLITARFAAEQGREVFAVPGSPLDPRAEGTNDLLKNGAALATSVDDVMQVVRPQIGSVHGWPRQLREEQRGPGTSEPLWEELDLDGERAPVPIHMPAGDDLDDGPPVPVTGDSAARIIGLLGPTPVHLDDLARMLGLDASTVQATVFELEFSGRVERQAGNRIALLSRPS